MPTHFLDDDRWDQDGNFLIITRPRTWDETAEVLYYSRQYSEVWRWWLLHPGDWIIAYRTKGRTIRIKPVPPKRVRQIIEKKKANGAASS